MQFSINAANIFSPMSEIPDSGTRITNLLNRAVDDPNALRELERFRRTLVVMFSDIQGSTAYFEKHGDAAGLFMVHRCNDTIRGLVEKHGGAVIKTIGDGTMATFPEAKSAVEAAIGIQTALERLSATRPESDRIGLRIGMHYGTGIVRTNDVFGDVVNMASRVESVAVPGQILVSEEIFAQVSECDFIIRKLGRFALKGKSGERTLFTVIWDQTSSPTASGIEIEDPSGIKPPNFKLRVVQRDGRGTDYPVGAEVKVGLSAGGKLKIAESLESSSVCARVFAQEESLFVEENGAAKQDIFLRLAGAYVLEHQDILLAGRQIFRYEEKRDPEGELAAFGTQPMGSEDPAGFVAELVRIGPGGVAAERYPLNAPEIQLGRTIGTYTFPSDDLMSRAHLRISQRGGDFVLDGVGSRNGTFVKMRKKSSLSVGSALLIAGQLLTVIR
jgi:class 3 adenylate cyclase